MIHAPIEGSVQVPVIDIVSFSFDKQNGYDDEMPLLVDADEPSRYLNNKTYRLLVRRLIAGFKAYGLQQGDSVLCQITNSVSYLPWERDDSIYLSLKLTNAVPLSSIVHGHRWCRGHLVWFKYSKSTL